MQEIALTPSNVVCIPLDPQARLRAALRMLETRLHQQRESVVAWRESMTELSGAMQDLRDSAEACQRSLAALGARARGAREVAAELDRNASRLFDASAALGGS